ncbi:MAG TPA: ABC transporter permease [Terriglobia bacterium]|nr:ABC transporter permease [Terriglobia bacterium]
MKREPQPDEQIVDVSALEPPALGPILATAPTDLPRDYWSIVGRQFRRNRIAVAGLAVVAGFFAIALLADFVANDKPLVMIYQGRIYFPVIKDYAVWLHLSRWQREFQNISYKEFVAANFKAGDWVLFPPIRYSQDEPDLRSAIQAPSPRHWLGTDQIGRDIASRVVHGSRVSLSVGFVAVSIYVFIGVIVGALAGYYGGIVDIVASRLIEIMLTIPTFFLIITVVAFLPPSILYIMLVIGITNWPTVARLTRGEFLKTKSLEYVVAARALGATDFRTIFRHILPNTIAPVFVAATFGVASAILIESTLSFLGFGVPPSTASWGSILSNARQLLPSGWWLTVFPGMAIFLTVTSYNLVGEGLRDAADPRLKG